jgi:hypothetical protein
MKYTIERVNGDPARHAASMQEALRIARQWLGVNRVYRGSRYTTDRPAGDGDRETCEALDVWRERKNVGREMSTPADAVISW